MEYAETFRATTNKINIFQRGVFFLKYFIIKMLVRYRKRDIQAGSIRVCDMMDPDAVAPTVQIRIHRVPFLTHAPSKIFLL